MTGKLARYLALLALLAVSARGQPTSAAVGGQHGSSFPGACPINIANNVIVTVVATLAESTTGPLSVRPSRCLLTTISRSSEVFLRNFTVAVCSQQLWCCADCLLYGNQLSLRKFSDRLPDQSLMGNAAE
jgi:hypothetical protein